MRWIAHQSAAVARKAAPALLAWALLAGCESTASQQYTEALDAWDARQYARALAGAREAQDAAERARDIEVRDKAAYLAGLASYQLGRLDDASKRLATAAESEDKQLAGKATAMLGAVALEQSRWSDAAALYTRAGDMLSGQEAVEARALARNAQERAQGVRPGSTASVPAATPAATPAAAPSAPAPTTRPAASSGTLTIVAGTYTSEVAARQRAGTLAAAAKSAGLAAPRVVPTSAPDRRVWLVEVGSFTDRAKAEAALKKLPATGCVVAQSQGR
ncbi:MAG: SPOR domain-containing protein [Phycisphaerae bacterium]|nr:SPOR domain-containing protein [Phycisphaerae bacterium]